MFEGKRIISGYKEKIYSNLFQKKHRIGNNSFIRQRKLVFPVIFSMILKLVTKSLSIECELLEEDESRIAASKQAFSKARYKIHHSGYRELLDSGIETAYGDSLETGTWRGYRMIAADGSSINIPVSEETEDYFGRFKCNGTQGRSPILGRVSLFVDLCTSMILSARLAPWNEGEQSLAEEQLPEVVHQFRAMGQEKLLFIYDRGYPSLKFIKQHKALKVDFLFRLQKGSYKAVWTRVEAGETDFDSVLNTREFPEGCKVRVLAITLKNGAIEVLITSLVEPEYFTLRDISKAYFLRWQIEECYKRLKIGAELENFSGKNLEAVFQEFWAHLVICNILAIYMCEKQNPWNPDDIPEYRLNFSVLFGVMREKIFHSILGNYPISKLDKLFDRVASRAIVKIRPERLYSRHKVGKPKRIHTFRRVC